MTIEMLGRGRSTTADPAFASLYAQVQRFYHQQMRLFDAEAGNGARHWIGMLEARPQPDGTVRTKCSALVQSEREDGRKGLHVRVLEDVLVRSGDTDQWVLRTRSVTRDSRV